MKSIWKNVRIYFITIILLIITGYPFVFVVLTSFKSQMEYIEKKAQQFRVVEETDWFPCPSKQAISIHSTYR